MKKLIAQLFKFGIVGGIAFLIDYGVFALLTILGMNYLIAQIISFSMSLVFNYIASIKWVFDAKKQTKIMTMLFIVLSIVGLEINEILLFIGVSLLKFSPLIVKLFATAVVMVFNFVTRKLIIERLQEKLGQIHLYVISAITLVIGVCCILFLA